MIKCDICTTRTATYLVWWRDDHLDFMCWLCCPRPTDRRCVSIDRLIFHWPD